MSALVPLGDPALPKRGSKLGKTIPVKVRQAVKDRSGGLCEHCGRPGANHLHHRKLRSQGGGHTVENLLNVRWDCHRSIHADPDHAYDMGWLVRSWADPAQVPLVVADLAAEVTA